MKRFILIFGFETMDPKLESNSAKLAKALDKLKLKGYDIRGKVFEPKFYELEAKILEYMHILDPYAVIIIRNGQSNKFYLPIYTQNMVQGSFFDEKLKKTKIARGMPMNYKYKVDLPLVNIYDQLKRKDYHVETENIPTDYIENYVAFLIMYYLTQNQLECPTGIITIPAKNISLVELVDAFDTILTQSIKKIGA